MRKLLFAIMLISFSAISFAQNKEVLSILMKDGSQVCFLLAEKPLITFAGDDVKVVSDTDEATIKRTLVDRFEFVAEMPTYVEDVEEKIAREQFELTRNVVHINGLNPGCKVQLFSINGQMVLSVVANENGSVTISIDSLPSGIYLVNYNEITVKFIKS